MSADLSDLPRGHLEECLRHLGKLIETFYPKGSKGAVEIRRPLADFCGVSADTVSRWFLNEKTLPIGVPRIKLIGYLTLFGYEVIEYERMDRKVRNFNDLICFNQLTVEEASAMLGYANTQTLLQVLQGKGNPLEDKIHKMYQIWSEKRIALEAAKTEAREKYRLEIFRTSGASHSTSTSTPRPTPAPARSGKNVTTAVQLMTALLTLIEDGDTPELTPDEVAELKKSGLSTVLRLSAKLSAWSSQLLTTNVVGGR